MDNADNKGTLILVVGPSGAGKDTLIDAAKLHFSDIDRIVFPKRLITREDKTGEDHTAVTPEQFEALMLSDGLFMHWEAHGLKYGISDEVRTQLETGYVVVLNISRKQIEVARKRWSRSIVIQITVNNKVLMDRLRARGRESETEIQGRIARSEEIITYKADFVVDNSGIIELAVEEFISLIEQVIPKSISH